MKVVEHLSQAKTSQVSFEIIPPERGGNIRDLLQVVEKLLPYQPPFIDVTSHAAELVGVQTEQGLLQKPLRKRLGTVGLCALLQHKYHVDAVPHVLCQGFTREETEDFLLELSYLEIDNVMALRGDVKYQKPTPALKTTNAYTVDLVKQIAALNNGDYVSSNKHGLPTKFCVGVAGYPEKHADAPDLSTDIHFLKEKVEAGASYIVTQMFFDNHHYFSFVEQCRAAGITVPILPGIKVLTSPKQLESLPRVFGISLPEDFQREIRKAEQKHCLEIGVEWAVQQIKGLRLRDVPAVHLYVMQNIKPIQAVVEKL